MVPFEMPLSALPTPLRTFPAESSETPPQPQMLPPPQGCAPAPRAFCGSHSVKNRFAIVIDGTLIATTLPRHDEMSQVEPVPTYATPLLNATAVCEKLSSLVPAAGGAKFTFPRMFPVAPSNR